MRLRPPGHAAFVVGVHGDEVGDSLGEAVGIGTHDELMESCPVYREIAQSQLTAAELA